MWNRSQVATWKVGVILRGHVEPGVRQASRRIAASAEVFERATGQRLFPGTLNVRVGIPVSPQEHFRICGKEHGDPNQDLLFEVCHINGILAYRICSYYFDTGLGGHGDDVLEIACAEKLPDVSYGSEVEIGLFRDTIGL